MWRQLCSACVCMLACDKEPLLYTKIMVTCAESITESVHSSESVHLFRECPSLLFGINSKELWTNIAAMLSLSHALRLVHTLWQSQPHGTVSCHCPVLRSISFLPVPGKGCVGNGDHPALHPLSSLSPLAVKVRQSPLTSSSVTSSGSTFWERDSVKVLQVLG